MHGGKNIPAQPEHYIYVILCSGVASLVCRTELLLRVNAGSCCKDPNGDDNARY